MRLRFLFVSLLILALPAQAAEIASPDDSAHFLAGMQVPSASPLARFEDAPAWKEQQRYLDAAFDRVEKAQLSKIRVWSKANLSVHEPTLFYMFSGPDFLYANAFFPDASTYVLSGLEPVGSIPDLTKLSRGAMALALEALRGSTRTVLNIGFFITRDMGRDLRASSVTGTLPVLYVFLARSGKTVHDVSLLQLDEYGGVQADPKPGTRRAQGVKITFSSPGGPMQTLYYFSTNIADDGFETGGLEPFCARLGEGNSFVKSASYLLHGGEFSQVRDFLLQNSASILQDDTGIPVTRFDSKWQLTPFGHYLPPIGIFARQYQPKLAALFRKRPYSPLDFGIGYRYRPNQSNLLLAVRLEDLTSGSR